MLVLETTQLNVYTVINLIEESIYLYIIIQLCIRKIKRNHFSKSLSTFELAEPGLTDAYKRPMLQL